MAKKDINRRGGLRKNRRYVSDKIAKYYARREIEDERLKNPRPKVSGIRTIVIEAFEKGGKDAAYKAINMANERIGKEVYTKKMVDEWINSHEQER